MSDLQGSTIPVNRDQGRETKTEPNSKANTANTKNGAKGLNDKAKSMSFAEQMATLNKKGKNDRLKTEQDQELEDQELNPKDIAKAGKEQLKSKFGQKQTKNKHKHNPDALAESDEEADLKKSHKKIAMSKQDTHRAVEQARNQETAQRQELDEDAHYSSKQHSMDEAAQDKQEQVNAGQTNQQQQSIEEQRKQQLAQWEILAPRLMEDGKNKAIRLDIPDVEDVKTVIVRMRGSNVDIQAIGSKDLVSIFKTKEGILRSILAKKNVRMGETQIFDVAKLYG
ncbi:MAG: hypothetical protein MK033_04945 [Candidatus Caenarcaniphilales bacterium]|nr:hypothetical protein [Candidatus Caenarcaniphilales bacterium]